MARHKIFYEFLEKPDNAFLDLDKTTPWGEGELEGDLDYIPSTPEEWKNLSREIAEYGNFHSVNVTRLLPLEGNFQVTEPTIQGEVIADES